jgi:iron-sulfur cluster assembly protein
MKLPLSSLDILMDVITMTGSAVARIKEMSAQMPEKFVRLSTTKGGCAAFKYVFDFVDAPGPHDEKASNDGATIYVDPQALMQVLGTEIDFKDDGLERKFVFNNPLEVSRCGCGESFSLS